MEIFFAILLMAVIGLLFFILGILVWKKENLSLFHSYHVDNVSPEDRAAFCKLSGIGLLIIGIGILLTALMMGLTGGEQGFAFLVIGLLVGFILLVIAGIKYN